MTRDDIIRMAFEASGGILSYDAEGRWILSEQEVIQLAALVAAAEREACAEIAEKQRFAMYISLTSHPPQNGTAVGIANEIRARGDK